MADVKMMKTITTRNYAVKLLSNLRGGSLTHRAKKLKMTNFQSLKNCEIKYKFASFCLDYKNI